MIENTPYQYNPEWYEILDSNRHRVATIVALKHADFIIKSVNNHDRLVEALERTGNALQRVTLSARSDNTTLTELKQSLEVYQEAKQLLAELKTQS